jgi:hypothetical protein
LLVRRWLLVFGVVAMLAGRVILDLLDKKPGGGIVAFVIGWPYLWFKILPSFLLGMVRLHSKTCYREAVFFL